MVWHLDDIRTIRLLKSNGKKHPLKGASSK